MRLREKKAVILGWVTRLLYSGKNILFGKNLKCDSVPTIIVDAKSKLTIGDDVILRHDIEIRAHKKSTMNIGSSVRVDRGVRILSNNSAIVDIGEGTRVGLYSVLNGGDSIFIGRQCLISGHVYIQTSMHRHQKGTFIQSQGYDHAPIVLGDDVWLGAHAVIFPGCTLGPGAIVGSNSVVTSDVRPNAIVVGAPAQETKERE